MRSEYFSFLFIGFSYFTFIAGVRFVFDKHIRTMRMRILLRHRLRKLRKRSYELSSSWRYLRNALFVSFKNPPDEKSFAAAVALLFVSLFLLGFRFFSLFTSLLVAGMGALIPLFLLVIKVESIRKKGSREGMCVVAALYRNYWIQNKNIFSAIEETVKGSSECPICKNLLYKLLLRLRNTGNPLEIRECIDQFAFSMGTVWGKMLGVCIRLSVETGIDISEGLSDIENQLRSANKRAEERRRLNSEASRMTVFLVPMLYAGTFTVSLYYLEVGLKDFLANQFATSEGLMFFIAATFLFVLNLAILELVQNKRIDY